MLLSEYSHQEETDIILEGEMKFFVWVSKRTVGFVVLPILREGELLYKGNETFFLTLRMIHGS